jgi:HPt (histidine-containing phosphotransfer) domain-containing protein
VTDNLEGRLAALRMRFLERANTDSAALEGIASGLGTGAAAGGDRQQIRRIAHSLAGTAGTFGFAAISFCAAELEEFVSNVPDSPELADACRILVAEIRRSV